MSQSYLQYEAQFEAANLPFYPASIQGFFAGYVSSGKRLQRKLLETLSAEYLNSEEDFTPDFYELLYCLYQQTLSDLSSVDMDFELLIASDEDADIDEQTEQVAAWCQGFLDGLGSAGIAGSQLDKDTQEVLADFDAITQVQVSDPENPENIELFEHLKEHCKMAALSVFYQFNRQTKPVSNQLH